MKIWAMPCRVTQDDWVIVKSSAKWGLVGEQIANHSSILAARTPWTVSEAWVIVNIYWALTKYKKITTQD